MNNTTQPKQKATKFLIYVTIGLLIVNFILMFLPFVEVYQPSSKKTVLGVTTYEGWYTDSARIVSLIYPIILTGIPYLCSIISFRNKKNSFFKIINNTVEKPIRFFWLKFAAIVNAFSIWMVYSEAQSNIGYLIEHGAYCHITTFGVLNICCTIVFLICLFILSHKTKSMFTLVNKTQTATETIQAIEEGETKENEQ